MPVTKVFPSTVLPDPRRGTKNLQCTYLFVNYISVLIFRQDSSKENQWYIIEVQADFKTKSDGISLNGHLMGDLFFTKKVF